jgi:LysM repeat protein
MLLILLVLIAACTPAPQAASAPVNISAHTLTPFSTSTPTTASPDWTITPLPNLQPTATPTPRSYTIRLGDTFSGIALYYGVTVNDLLLANPNVNPNALIVGQVVYVPAPKPQSEGSTSGNPTPTAVPLTFSNPDCYPSLEGGVWCFLLVRNENANPIENMTAVIHVAGVESGQVYTQPAMPPLDLIPAGGSLPLVAYFPAPMPQVFQASAELTTAFYVPTGDTRYLTTRLENPVTTIAPNGLSAFIAGQVIVDGGTAANLVWVVATAFDADGHVVGVRRWESTQALAPGQPLGFSFNVYSSADAITRVELALEARP